MSAIASALACTLKFVNLFARCHHLFDIAEKHRVTSVRIFCRILLPNPCSNFAQNVIVVVLINLVEIRSVFLGREGNIYGTGQKLNGQGKNIILLLQHRLWRHKNREKREEHRTESICLLYVETCICS